MISFSLVAHLLLILLGVLGAWLAIHIYRKKRKEQPLVCPLHADCETVVHSEFSSFFGVPVELLGAVYYGLIALFYTAALAVPDLLSPLLSLLFLVITTTAFLFSLYLTFLQAFTIKQWCSWCLTSAGMSVLIFFLTIFLVLQDAVPLMAAYKEVFVGIHLLGFALGLGGATLADVLFFKFLKDYNISTKESDVLATISQVIWFGLAIVIISGLALYLPEMARLNNSSKFLLKVTAVAVILVNGAFLNLKIAPKLVKMCFGDEEHPDIRNMSDLRRLAFALGAVSFTSWYTAFVLGLVKSIPLPYFELLLIYIGLVSAAVLGSQVYVRWINSRAS